MKIKKSHIIGWLVLGMIVFTSYYLLGGFTEVELTVKEHQPYYLTGKQYIGSITDRSFDSLVEATHKAYSNGVLSGSFSICFMGNPDEQDTIEVFVGTWHTEEIVVPNGYIQKKHEGGKAIFASIEAEAVVAPSATETNEKIIAYANENNLSIKGRFIERYDDDFKIVTIVPVE